MLSRTFSRLSWLSKAKGEVKRVIVVTFLQISVYHHNIDLLETLLYSQYRPETDIVEMESETGERVFNCEFLVTVQPSLECDIW